MRFAAAALLALTASFPAGAQEQPDDELAAQLQRARAELMSLEEQIGREETRLSRIESELVDLRRQAAIFGSAESAFQLGEELYMAGSIVWARDAFESVIQNFPGSQYHTEALFRLELIYFELQDFDNALAFYDSLRTRSPGFLHMDLATIAAGLSHHNLGRFAMSRGLMSQIQPQSEYAALAQYLTAVAYVEEGSYAEAKTALEGILQRARTHRAEAGLADRARIALAQIYVEEGNFDRALEFYGMISPFSPYYDVGMLGMVWVYMRRQDYQDAYNLAQRVVEEVPNSELRSEFELAMANCALGAEDLDVAIDRYEQLLRQHRESEDYYELFLSGSSGDQYQSERERLERIRAGLAELKEQAYASGAFDVVEIIEQEEEALRQMFIQISGMEASQSLPAGQMDTQTMERELNRLISESRASTDALALSVEETRLLAEAGGTDEELSRLAAVESEVQRIRLSLQDLASKFDEGMTQEHDWIQETQYGIAIAYYMERELRRDSLAYLGTYYQRRIQEAYAAGDSGGAQGLILQRQVETSALQDRIEASAVQCTALFEEYISNFPESRFSADVLVRLAQLYYDLDNSAFLDRIASASPESGLLLEDYTRSIDLYNRVLNSYPGSEVEDVALYSLGYCLDKMGDPQGAVSSYRRLLEEHPNSALAPETNIRAGDFYFDSFAFDSAEVYYRRILDYPQADPDLFQLGVYKLGWTYYLLNDYLRSAAVFAYLIVDGEAMDSLGIPRRGGAMIDESMEYIAHDFMEQTTRPPVALATDFLDSFARDTVTTTILRFMGDYYRSSGYWNEAVGSYEALLARYPDSRQAPFIQAGIAACYDGMGNTALATQARERLVEQYGSGSEWALALGDSSAVEELDSLRASSLEQAITYHHSQAVASREDPVASAQNYQALAGRIETYLAEFGDNRQSYDFRFYLGDAYYALGRYMEAGDTYFAVAMDSSSQVRQKDACINAMGSFFTAYAEEAGIDSAQVRQRQVEAVNYYMSRFPSGEYIDQFLFAAAGNAYNARDYETARSVYMTLYNNYPSSEYVARSARFIAAAFEAQEMFSQAEQWYGLASDAAARTGEDLGEDFELLAATAAYRDAATLAETEDVASLVQAAQRFEQSAREHPGSAVAPAALYDAGETYAKAGAINDAMRVFDELARYYPQSELAPQGLLRSAFLSREAGMLVEAGNVYRLAYQLFPGAPDMGSALFSAAVSYEDAGRKDLAVQVYDEIINSGRASAEILTQIYGKYGEYLYDMGSYSTAREMFTNSINLYDQYRQGDAYYPAMSAFYLGEMAFTDYSYVSTTVETAQAKTQLMQTTESWYGKSLTYFTDIWFMASCVRAGELYEDYANAIGYMQPPAGLDDAGIQAFYDQLFPVMDAYLQKALEVYRTAVEKAISAGIMNDWVIEAADHLELLAPGTVQSLGGLPGYGPAPAAVDTTSAGAAPPVTGVEDSQTVETGQSVTEQQPDALPPASTYEEPEEEGGGCFLWPF